MTTELQPFEPLRKRQPYASQYADFPDPREEYGYAFPGNPHCDEARHIERITMSDGNRAMAAILDEAKGIVCGDRQDSYGEPQDNHSRTAEAVNWYLKYCPRASLDSIDIAWLNVLQKISRDLHCRKRDNRLDAIGFIANAEACSVVDSPLNGT